MLNACIEAGKIVIMQAANTGLTGGSTPDGDTYDRDVVIISTLRIDRTHLLDAGKQVVCLPGATLFELEKILHPLGRNPHSVIGSSCIGTSVFGGVCNNSGGALVHRGPAFTQMTLYAQVDIRPGQIGRRSPVDLGLVGDVRATVTALLPKLLERSQRQHLDLAVQHYHRTRAESDTLTRARPGKRPIHPQQIAKAFSEFSSHDAIFTCDVGLPTVWAARYLAMNGKRRLIGSFWHGSMAQAIGAQSAYTGRQDISMSGDGGFAMLMGDLLSLVQLKLPAKIIVFNNGTLGFIEVEQKSTGFLPTGTELANPNFGAMAEAIGIRGIRLEDPEDVEDGIKAALAHDGPVLVDAVVARTELPVPPSINIEMTKGFTLYTLKAVFSGKGDQLIDLAETNLWH